MSKIKNRIKMMNALANSSELHNAVHTTYTSDFLSNGALSSSPEGFEPHKKKKVYQPKKVSKKNKAKRRGLK
jgi:hypothetical protein